MEVKIKDQDKLVDATIEMVDGVMVVSPKNVYVPKDGDVVVNSNFVFIYRDALTVEAHYYVASNIDRGTIELEGGAHIGYINQLRLANDIERDLLFNAIDYHGYEWLADERKLVKKKWKPKSDGIYYYPSMKPQKGRIISYPKKERNTGLHFDKEIIDTGWVFKTQEECQEFCNRLNSYISSIKP